MKWDHMFGTGNKHMDSKSTGWLKDWWMVLPIQMELLGLWYSSQQESSWPNATRMASMWATPPTLSKFLYMLAQPDLCVPSSKAWDLLFIPWRVNNSSCSLLPEKNLLPSLEVQLMTNSKGFLENTRYQPLKTMRYQINVSHRSSNNHYGRDR